MRFEIYKAGREYRWRLKARNGKIIACGEGYQNKGDCLKCVRRIQESAGAQILDLTEAK